MLSLQGLYQELGKEIPDEAQWRLSDFQAIVSFWGKMFFSVAYLALL